MCFFSRLLLLKTGKEAGKRNGVNFDKKNSKKEAAQGHKHCRRSDRGVYRRWIWFLKLSSTAKFSCRWIFIIEL